MQKRRLASRVREPADSGDSRSVPAHPRPDAACSDAACSDAACSDAACSLGAAVWNAATRRSIQKIALAWFAQHARDLPWRRTRDPYRVWLSEVMLQQTQVATVVGYFERFLTAFPTVAALAAADEQRVLRLWEGLGYYRRARQLHAAARRIVSDHAAEFPRTAAELRSLPGIGRYTAGAVASIAFDAREPILEANTIRLFARLTAERSDVTSSAAQARLWSAATEVLPATNVGQFNQALMEIGALVCTPRLPRCDECPLVRACHARRLGLENELPNTRQRVTYEKVLEAAVVVQHRGRVLVRQCGPGERWAGLWDFPRFGLRSPDSSVHVDELRTKTQEQTGVSIEPQALFATIRHGVTRFRITLHCYFARPSGPIRNSSHGPTLRWINPAELAELPLSVTARQISRLIQKVR